MKYKRGNVHLQLIDVIAGTIIMAGGAVVAFGMINFGSLLASFGLVVELIKLILEKEL